MSVTVFADVTVIPMDTERTLPHRDVIVKEGRIAALAPTAQAPASPGVRVIDGRGCFLLPGLCDMHIHLTSPAYALLCIACGVTTVRNMWGTPRHLALRAAIARGEHLGPRIVTAGPLLDGSPPIWEGSAVVETAEAAAQAVCTQAQAGYDFAKVYNRLLPEPYTAIVGTARKLGLPVAGHVPQAVGLDGVLAARQDSIEHLEGYVESCQRADSPVAGRDDFPSLRRSVRFVEEALLRRAAERTREAGTWNCVTLAVTGRRRPRSEMLSWLDRPELRYMPPLVRARWHPDNDPRLARLTEDAFADLAYGEQVRRMITGALRAAGARLLAGTDAPNPFVVPGFALHEELQNLVDAGLTPFEALAAATRDAAEYLGLAGELGSIAQGSAADLVLLDANPLDRISNTRCVRGVMLRGRWLPRGEIDGVLAALAASFEPERDRFAAVARSTGGVAAKHASHGPPRPSASAVETTHAYVYRWSGVTAGEERLRIVRLPKEGLAVHAEAVVDDPFAGRCELHAEFDGARRLLSFSGSIQRGFETLTAHTQCREGALYLAVDAVAAGEVTSAERLLPEGVCPLLPPLLPGVPMVGSLLAQLVSLRHGGSPAGSHRTVVVGLQNSFALHEAEIQLAPARAADATASGSVHELRIAQAGCRGILTVDDNGIRSFVVADRRGELGVWRR